MASPSAALIRRFLCSLNGSGLNDSQGSSIWSGERARLRVGHLHWIFAEAGASAQWPIGQKGIEMAINDGQIGSLHA
jgi:hypothetical protein